MLEVGVTPGSVLTIREEGPWAAGWSTPCAAACERITDRIVDRLAGLLGGPSKATRPVRRRGGCSAGRAGLSGSKTRGVTEPDLSVAPCLSHLVRNVICTTPVLVPDIPPERPHARTLERAVDYPGMAGAPTPAIAVLQKAKIAHTLLPYEHDPRNTHFGDEAVAALGRDAHQVFKTLVAEVDGRLVVGVVPVAGSLDLKRLAAAVGGKKAVMAAVADAERSSGYVAGGISPLGQRKRLPTVIDSSAEGKARICVSAGKRGLQVELAPADLAAATGGRFAPIAEP